MLYMRRNTHYGSAGTDCAPLLFTAAKPSVEQHRPRRFIAIQVYITRDISPTKLQLDACRASPTHQL